MIQFRAAALLLLASHMAVSALPPVVCPAGAPIGNVDLRVKPTDGESPLPLRTINRLEEGETIQYRPILRSTEVRKGEVALVLVPARKRSDSESLVVLEPKPADKPQEWTVPAKTSVAAFVYGPSGLNRKKVKTFLAKDEDLISQLADYAEKTAQTEALIQALTSDTNSGQSVDAAFRGFASQYGMATQIDRTQPTGQQMALALRTLNPALSSYDPIASQSSQRVGQTASLVTSVAALFFGSPVGLAAGGTAMLMEVHSVVFPNTVFRSSLAQTLPGGGLGLCGGREPVPAHTKVAYLWATRVPNVGPPFVQIQKAESVPLGLNAPVTVEVKPESDWKYLSRARNWALEPELASKKPIPVPVREGSTPKTLDVDLAKAVVEPGRYHLVAGWDWENFAVKGDLLVEPLSNFQKARLEPTSQDLLITKSGKVRLTLEGSNFEFVNKVELTKPADKFFSPAPVPFALPQGFRLGPQTHMELQVNTEDLEPGDYKLVLQQPDGKPHPIAMAVLPEAPVITGLPLKLNAGDKTREIVLKGQRLGAIKELRSSGAEIELGAATDDGTQRPVTLRLVRNAAVGREFDMAISLEGRTSTVDLPRGIQVVAPRSKIVDSRVSIPAGVDLALNPGELPSNFVLSAMLKVENLTNSGTLVLGCRGDRQSQQTLRVGAKSATASLERLAPEQLFLTFDDSYFPSGCDLVVQMADQDETPSEESYSLGRVVRVPKIESVQLEDSPTDKSSAPLQVTIVGQNLETIDQIGWDPEHGSSVQDLPVPLSGDMHKQMLRAATAAPPLTGSTPLYVWLRGETAGRATLLKAQLPAKSRLAAAPKTLAR